MFTVPNIPICQLTFQTAFFITSSHGATVCLHYRSLFRILHLFRSVCHHQPVNLLMSACSASSRKDRLLITKKNSTDRPASYSGRHSQPIRKRGYISTAHIALAVRRPMTTRVQLTFAKLVHSGVWLFLWCILHSSPRCFPVGVVVAGMEISFSNCIRMYMVCGVCDKGYSISNR